VFQKLPVAFREWVEAFVNDGFWCESMRALMKNGYCSELVRRCVWHEIDWDHEMLTVLSTKFPLRLAFPMSEGFSSSNAPCTKVNPMTLGSALGELFDPRHPQEVMTNVRQFLLAGGLGRLLPLSTRDWLLLVHIIVDLFVSAISEGRIPDSDLQGIFGIQKTFGSGALDPPRHMSQCGISDLVFSAWSTLYRAETTVRNEDGGVHNEKIHKGLIVEAVRMQKLPCAFQQWVEEHTVAESTCPYCHELVRRGAWNMIPWDQELLVALRDQSNPPQQSSVPAPVAEVGDPSKNRRVVWIKIPKDEHGVVIQSEGIKSALRGDFILERLGTWRKMQEFVNQSGWIPHRCGLLEYLGEDVILYAEPSVGRKEPATYLCSAVPSGIAPATIFGKALLVRRSGDDLTRDTVERFIHFRADLSMIFGHAPHYEDSEAGLWRALSSARSHWPDYQVGDQLSYDGNLERQSHGNSDQPALSISSGQHTGPMDNEATLGTGEGTQRPLPVDSAASAGCPSDGDSVNIVLLEFSRNPAPFHDLLQHGIVNDLMLHDLAECRRALDGRSFQGRLESGAYIFVSPDVYEAVLAHISSKALHIGTGHVVVAEALEASVMRAVLALPRKHKIQAQSRQCVRMAMGTRSSADATTPPESEPVILVRRSFIHVVIPSSLDSAVPSGPRTASTTDANSKKGANPRSRAKRSSHRKK